MNGHWHHGGCGDFSTSPIPKFRGSGCVALGGDMQGGTDTLRRAVQAVPNLPLPRPCPFSLPFPLHPLHPLSRWSSRTSSSAFSWLIFLSPSSGNYSAWTVSVTNLYPASPAICNELTIRYAEQCRRYRIFLFLVLVLFLFLFILSPRGVPELQVPHSLG